MLTELFIFSLLLWKSNAGAYDEEKGRDYLDALNELTAKKHHDVAIAEWNYQSNITDENFKIKLELSKELARFTKVQWLHTKKFPWHEFIDPDLRRQFKKFSYLGTSALPENKYEKLEVAISEMTSRYGKAKICDFHNKEKCTLSLEPDLTEIFANSRNESELKHVWIEWRKQTGTMRPFFTEYVSLSNEAAKLNNFNNTAEEWLDDYESNDFQNQIANIWDQLRPFYLELHAFVRRKLREQYGQKLISERGPIPAHLLGNMWAQSWSNIFDILTPFPNVLKEDITSYLGKQKYTPHKIFKVAEEFFTSLNLSEMPQSFWNNSILQKPFDREIICHASAWDFSDSKDFRIKQCTEITKEHFQTAHHEMGHIQYYIQYKDQPFIYRAGANPGFHEAIGDVIGLSVSTPKHLKKIGLLPTSTFTREAEMNYLLHMALDKIAFLPFAYMTDLWRWGVFRGEIKDTDYNCEWWKLALQYQGIKPPVTRTEYDFDPTAKYHIASNTEYIRYFVSFIIQFQFHEALCIKAKMFDPNNSSFAPLHHCDIYQSKEAGELLKSVLSLGSSKPWQDAMEIMTGQRNMDAAPLLRYFSPVYNWLKEENNKSGEYVGWDDSQYYCVKPGRLNSIKNFFGSIVNKIKSLF